MKRVKVRRSQVVSDQHIVSPCGVNTSSTRKQVVRMKNDLLEITVLHQILIHFYGRCGLLTLLVNNDKKNEPCLTLVEKKPGLMCSCSCLSYWSIHLLYFQCYWTSRQEAVSTSQKPLLDPDVLHSFGQGKCIFMREKSRNFNKWCLWQSCFYTNTFE